MCKYLCVSPIQRVPAPCVHLESRECLRCSQYQSTLYLRAGRKASQHSSSAHWGREELGRGGEERAHTETEMYVGDHKNCNNGGRGSVIWLWNYQNLEILGFVLGRLSVHPGCSSGHFGIFSEWRMHARTHRKLPCSCTLLGKSSSSN